jgi:hypothetical protein
MRKGSVGGRGALETRNGPGFDAITATLKKAVSMCFLFRLEPQAPSPEPFL